MSDPVPGFILAGGKGTRLQPITLEIPKPLLTIGRKPIVEHLTSLFKKHAIDPIHVIVYHEDLPLFERWERDFEHTIHFIKETERLGTWGRLKRHLQEVDQKTTFLVSNGDELKDIDISKLIDFHRSSHALVTLGTVEVENPSDYGVVESDADGRVCAFHYKPETPPSNHIMAGVYVVEPSVLALGPHRDVLSFEEDILPAVIAEGGLYECMTPGRWNDCGTFERYETAIREWTGKSRDS